MWTYRNSQAFQLSHSTALTLFVSAGVAWAQEQSRTDPASEPPQKSSRFSASQVKDKQLDVSLETRDVERVLGKLKKASDLAKQRITEAAEMTESVTASLNKGDSSVASTEARQATEKFKEIVKQLEALLKEETPQQIVEAQQLARQLAKLEREFAERYEGMLNPVQANSSGDSKVDPKSQLPPMADKEAKMKGAGNSSREQGSGKTRTGDTSPTNGAQKPENPAPEESKGKDRTGDPSQKKPADQGSGADSKEGENSQGNGDKNRDQAKEGSGSSDPRQDSGEDQQESSGGGTAAVPGEKKTGGPGNDESNERSDERPRGKGNLPGTKKESTGDAGPGAGPEQLREELGRQADKLAETGKTLQDVLNSIARSESPGDKEAANRIQEILKEFNLQKIIDQMEGTNGLIRSKKDTEAKLSSLDLAERFEILAQRLDTAYRAIVVPQAEELRKLEQALIELKEKLEQLETPSQVNSWHREVRELLERADQLGVSAEVRAQFEEELRKGGFAIDRDPTRRDVNWSLVNDRYVAPGAYLVALTNIQEDVQTRIQTLLLGDMGRLSDDAAPPAYQSLIDRYYQVLSGETGMGPAPQSAKPDRNPKGK